MADRRTDGRSNYYSSGTTIDIASFFGNDNLEQDAQAFGIEEHENDPLQSSFILDLKSVSVEAEMCCYIIMILQQLSFVSATDRALAFIARLEKIATNAEVDWPEFFDWLQGEQKQFQAERAFWSSNIANRRRHSIDHGEAAIRMRTLIKVFIAGIRCLRRCFNQGTSQFTTLELFWMFVQDYEKYIVMYPKFLPHLNGYFGSKK